MAWKLPNFALINSHEKELIDLIQESNSDENNIWKVPNLLIPIATVVLALICNLAFGTKRWDVITYINLVVNGSLPLIAINQISALGIQIFDFDKSKEQTYQIGSTKSLRMKLFYYSIAIIIVGVIDFAHQVINSPFPEKTEPLILLVISSILVIFSSNISKKIFFLQENMINKTFDQKLTEEIKEKGHGKRW